MSTGVKGSASRVSIPSGVTNTIENIKEITGQNHTEDEIYAMLKECSMDPNETTQKLLQLDTFHEVKRKRDKRKENLSKEPAELKWKPGTQARANRVGRGNYSSRYTFHDAGGGRNSTAVKEGSVSHLTDKGVSKDYLVNSQDVRKSGTSSIARPTIPVSNGPSSITSENANVMHANHASSNVGANSSSKSEGPLLLTSPADSIQNCNAAGANEIQQHQMLGSNSPTPISAVPASMDHLSFNPISLSTQDSLLPNAGDTGKSEVGIQYGTAEPLADNPGSKASSASISNSEAGACNLQKEVSSDHPGAGKNQPLEPTQAAASAVGVSTSRRPPSNYNNHSQVIGSQKGALGKEWKPKSANANNVMTTTSSEASAVSAGAHSESETSPAAPTSKDTTLELQRKLEESHISEYQHVIIPNHLHVPEVAKLGFCFGSFDASFGLDMNQNGVLRSDKSPSLSESSEAIDEPLKEPQLSDQSVLVTAEDSETKYPDPPQSPIKSPENVASNEGEVSSSITSDYSESKPEVAPGTHQHTVVHTSNYNFGFMPPILGGQPTPLEGLESQARDASRLPGFVVPQSFDLAGYYAQFYRSGVDGDGRISPFHPVAAANKYSGNATSVSAQVSQNPQEFQGGPLVLSTAPPTPLVTQAAGVMQSAPNQQPIPVFRQPAGVHLPHYPPNYVPYGPYFSPIYVPPPTIHQFLSNGAFPQQPQAGGMYPSAPGTTAKYPPSQYKQGSNTGSSAHIGLAGNYGPYGLSMANYSSSSVTAVSSTPTEDIAPPQMKDNNFYASGQQNEGSGVWFTTPGRDISTLQASSFYNLPQGQLAFAPPQPSHGTFTGVFHPAQAVTAANVHPLLQQSQAITNPVDMVGQASSVYQQPQHAQLNWPSNY